MEEAQRPLTVSEVNRAVKTCVERSFPQLWVRGELSDLTVHASGHVYFSLKDATSQLRGAAFRYAQQAMQMRLERGMEVDVCGRITVYEPRGEYQLQASSITPVGAGELNRLFEELKLKLGAEGLFDPSRKRPIPTMPRIIGLITSWSGAAIQDFLRVLNRRFSGMHVRVIPSLVQGAEAPPKLIKAIEYFNKTHSCDVIVLTRGGGSVEDLWAFNDEQLARAIAASEIPVVSAVGHERDHSISDFVADYAAATPTAAAEFLVRGKAELGERLETIEKRMAGVMQLRVANLHRRYERASSCPMLSHPEDYVNRLSQQVDYLGAGRVVAVGDSSLEFFSLAQENKPVLIKSIPLPSEISVYEAGNGHAAFLYSDPSTGKMTLNVYDTEGELNFMAETSGSFRSLVLAEKGVLFLSDTGLSYRDYKGRVRYSGSPAQTGSVMFMDGARKIIQFDGSYMYHYRLR